MQIGVSCGYVAARNAVTLQLSPDWKTAPLGDSTDRDWITDGNRELRPFVQDTISSKRRDVDDLEDQGLLLDLISSMQHELRADEARLASMDAGNSVFLRNDEVHRLAVNWLQIATAADDALEHEAFDYVSSITSFDLTLRQVVRDLEACFEGVVLPRPINPRHPSMRLCISKAVIGLH